MTSHPCGAPCPKSPPRTGRKAPKSKRSAARRRRRRLIVLTAGAAVAGLVLAGVASWRLHVRIASRRGPAPSEIPAVARAAPPAPVPLVKKVPARIQPMPPSPPVMPLAPMDEPAAPARLVTHSSERPFKRLDMLTDEALRQQLLAVPEIALDQVPNTSTQLVLASLSSRGKSYPGPAVLLSDHAAMNGMPFLLETDCSLAKEGAETLRSRSTALHNYLRACRSSNGPDAKPFADHLRQLLTEKEADAEQWRAPAALPALLQVLQVEDASVRLLLVDLLTSMDDPRAQAALAGRALLDVSPKVREAAVRALARRPPRTYRAQLLAGFRYPWPPVAAHAAEALVALGDRGAVPQLEALADELPPGLPSPAVAGLPRTLAVRELVRVNHFKNCLLCHAPSFNTKDNVRALVPIPGQVPASPGGTYYEGSPNDLFVRADVTYLRQDFSLLQPVKHPPKNWPNVQRFDYLVRVRALTAKEAKRSAQPQHPWTQQYRAALDFAIRELSAEHAEGAVLDAGS